MRLLAGGKGPRRDVLTYAFFTVQRVCMMSSDNMAQAIRQEWSRAGWRWFATYSFPPVRGIEGAERWKRRFFQLLHATARQGLAARGWCFRLPHCHAHLLLSSRDLSRPLFPDVEGEAVEGAAYEALKAAWMRETGRRGYSLDIRPIYDGAGLAGYLAGVRNASRLCQAAEYLAPVNARLLKRLGL